MDISEFTIRLLFLFLPGIICSYIVNTFTGQKKQEVSFFLLQSFVLGIFSYTLLTLFAIKTNIPVAFWDALFDVKAKTPIPYFEIGLVFICSVVLGIFIIFIIKKTRKIIFKTLHFLKITKDFAEANVWEYTFNLEEVEWITVRDIKNDIMYTGWVHAFSEDPKLFELLLRDVSVYKNSTGEQMYQVGMMYLPINIEEIRIEIGTIPVDKKVKWEDKKRRL